MLNIMKEGDLTPEELSKRIGISGMTIRRWSKSQSKEIPKLYVPAIRDACRGLIAEGRLNANSESSQSLFRESSIEGDATARQHLGLSSESASFVPDRPDGFIDSLFEIGARTDHQEKVMADEKSLKLFRRMGKEWTSRIDMLWKAINSKEIKRVDKFAAFGALFYLITPFDFVPDQIPMFGLMDDFIVLGIAVGFYQRRFSNLFHQKKV